MINRIVLIGRLVVDPELKTTNSGVSVTSFTIAVDRRYAPKGEEKQSDFIQIVAWKYTAEFVCKYFKKGDMIALEGSLQSRNYEDKNGNKRTAFEVVADNVSFCGKKESAEQGKATEEQGKVEVADDDDLPF